MTLKFKLYREFGAANSGPVFDALEAGITKLGHNVVDDPAAIPVIWSVLWYGKMRGNREVYYSARNRGQPVFILEVGSIQRGVTWKLAANHINRTGIYGNTDNLDLTRPAQLNLSIPEVDYTQLDPRIQIATQHSMSMLWDGQPSLSTWLRHTVAKIKSYSRRGIVVRPHPRSLFGTSLPGVDFTIPRKTDQENFDFNFNFHTIVNHNSGVGVQAALRGIQVVCDESSLAYPVSTTFKNIHKISHVDRSQWLLEIAHTEWLLEELATGVPLQRVIAALHIDN